MILQCQGETYEVEKEVAFRSVFLKDMLEQTTDDPGKPVQLENLDSAALSKV